MSNEITIDSDSTDGLRRMAMELTLLAAAIDNHRAKGLRVEIVGGMRIEGGGNMTTRHVRSLESDLHVTLHNV
jgi:hypothetical protein